MRIPRDRPALAIMIINAVMEETRRRILELLWGQGPKTLTEIQEHIGKSLPTLQFHISILERSGIVSWRLVKKGKRRTKAYYIKEGLIDMTIDLPVFLNAFKVEEIKKYLELLADKAISGQAKIDRDPKIEQISAALGIPPSMAVAIRDFILTYEEEFLEILDKKLGVDIDESDVLSLGEKTGIDLYWLIRLMAFKQSKIG